MTESTLQLKAVLFILLLAGNEAYRVHSLSALQRSTDEPQLLQPDLQTQSKVGDVPNHCRWNLWRGGCVGEGCVYRPLPFDDSGTESCRLSDEYMLRNSSEFVLAQADILKEKAKAYSEECQSRSKLSNFSWRRQARCLRRSHRMLRSAQFLIKAQTANEQGFANHSEEVQARMTQGLELLASTLGPQGPYVLKLKMQMDQSAHQIITDTEQYVKNFVALLSDLITGSDAAKEQAKKSIDDKQVERDAQAPSDEPAEVEATFADLRAKYNESDAVDVLSNLEALTVADVPYASGASLLQVNEGAMVHSSSGYHVVDIIVVIIAVLILGEVIATLTGLAWGWPLGLGVLITLILIYALFGRPGRKKA